MYFKYITWIIFPLCKHILFNSLPHTTCVLMSMMIDECGLSKASYKWTPTVCIFLYHNIPRVIFEIQIDCSYITFLLLNNSKYHWKLYNTTQLVYPFSYWWSIIWYFFFFLAFMNVITKWHRTNVIQGEAVYQNLQSFIYLYLSCKVFLVNL